jgi:excisionase family DNA binding protein
MQQLHLPVQDKHATLTREEAAAYLRVSLRTIDRMREDGTLRWRRVRHSIRILASSVFIEEPSDDQTRQG